MYRTEVHEVIRKWGENAVITQGIRNRITITDNWRIDQQGTNNNGPDGRRDPRFIWANLQIQYGGKSAKSSLDANTLRGRGKSTSVAEVHAPLGVVFSTVAFQRAFAESASLARDGGVQVWMLKVDKNGKFL